VILPLHRNLDEKFLVLRPGPHYKEQRGYNTVQLAQQDGAVVLAYGYVFVTNNTKKKKKKKERRSKRDERRLRKSN
jgi:hypothetical protein